MKTTIKLKINQEAPVESTAPAHTRKTVYLSDKTLKILQKLAKIHKTSFSKALDEFVIDHSTTGPKNNLSQWIAKDMSDEDFEEIQKNIRESRVTSTRREDELDAILNS